MSNQPPPAYSQGHTPYQGQPQQYVPPQPGQQYQSTNQSPQHYAQPVQYMMSPQPQIVVVNPAMACPAGGAHFITSDFSCCGIAMAIIFFPIGILCCLAMRDQRCAKCGMSFGDGC